jgi:hypothetical protein
VNGRLNAASGTLLAANLVGGRIMSHAKHAKHTKLVCSAGLSIVGLGILLCICGNSFSTQWHALGDEAWAGNSNPTLALSLRTLGNIALLCGFVLLAGAAWTWLNAKERELVDLPKP